jgi:hypothetical protein
MRQIAGRQRLVRDDSMIQGMALRIAVGSLSLLMIVKGWIHL